MKREPVKKCLCVMMILFSHLFTACNYEDIVYSCDESTNNWVIENLQEIKSMTRDDWKSLDIEKLKPAYRAFTQDQRVKFWLEKMKEIKNLRWTEKELQHIEKIEEFISKHQDFFSGERLTDEQSDVYDLFFYTWQQYAINELGWSNRVCISMAGSGLSITDTLGNALKKPYPPQNCHCNVDHDFCEYYVSPCIKGNCEPSNMGCSWLWLSECDGLCNGI
jgi:hypothetical protein